MKSLLAAIFCFSLFVSSAQFKADNVKYKTVFPEDLCKALQANPGYVLLDVRSDGEFNDTMNASPALNIGHLQNALHINITQLAQRWKELSGYKDKPVFIYCSHSQRSRRASRMLADSGFTNIFNINGGLTNFYDQAIQSDPCGGYSIVTTVPYKIVSAKQLAANKTKYFIVDIRSDSVFDGTTLNDREKMEGRFVNAYHAKENFFQTASIDWDHNRPLLIVDEYGDKSPLLAAQLIHDGFRNVSILFDGMDGWINYITNSADKPAIRWTSYSSYKMLSSDEFSKWIKDKRTFSLIDIRPKDQFNNQSKNYWQNIGHIKNAANLPYSELASTSITPSNSNPVVLYGFNSEDEIFDAAKWFKQQGYQNIYILQGGIWRLRWASHNLKDKAYLNDLVVNVPPENE